MDPNGNIHDAFARMLRKPTFNKNERALWKQRRRSMSPGKRNRRDVRPIYKPRYERGRHGSKYDRKG